MINLYDPRSYVRAFELDGFAVDDEVTFFIPSIIPGNDGWKQIDGTVTAIYLNRIDGTDHWIRVRQTDGGEYDYALKDVKLEIPEANLTMQAVKFAPAPGFTRADVKLPEYKTTGAAAFDFYAAEDRTIPPGDMAFTVTTGLVMEIPEGWECQVRPRSGMSKELPLIIPNSPGTIDSDYRGEVKIMFRNLSKSAVRIKKGERIAQGKMAIAPQFDLVWADKLSETERGAGGFGSTGK